MCQYCQPLIKAIDDYLQKANDNLAATLKTVGFEAPKKTVKYINSIEDAVAEALKAETDYIVAEAEKAGSLFEFAAKWQKIKDGDALDTAIADIFAQNFEEFVPAYVKRYIAETDPELAYGKVKKDATADRISNKTSAWIQSWSGELGSMMKLNSSNEIENILTTGLQSGEGVAWFTQQLMESGIRDEYYKVRRVAVTEVLRAHSVAQQEAFMQDPSVEKKKWRHSGSYRNSPRQNHVDMDGQIVAKNEPYTLYGAEGGIYYPMYPRDSSLPAGESINCHCISQPVADEDILGMSLEEREQLRQEAIDNMDTEWEEERASETRTTAGVTVPSVEGESSKPKYSYAESVIDAKQIASAEYQRKFDSLGESKKVTRSIRAKAKEILRHRSGTKYEDLTYIDTKTGKSYINKSYDKENTCRPSRSMTKALRDADDYSIIGLHNHPGSSVPSIDDICVAVKRKYKYGVVVCHNGIIFKYTINGSINEANVNIYLAKVHSMLYNEDAEGLKKPSNNYQKMV